MSAALAAHGVQVWEWIERMRALTLFVLLAVVWALSSGHIDPDHHGFLIGCGVVSCVATTWLGLRMGAFDRESDPLPILPRSLLYVPWLLWQIVLSNIHVVIRVWRPKDRIRPSVFTIPYDLVTPMGIAVYANSITLTPGTVTIDIRQGEMLIHAVTKETADDLKGDGMHRQVRKLEGRS